jgi:hypothetical protein
VHGLNGDRVKSWTHVDPTTKRETMWLRDVLPNRVPVVRVMSFGWIFDDEGTTQGSITTRGVTAKALELLDAICAARAASEEV